MRRMALVGALVLAGCGRVPTAPAICTAANSYAVDTVHFVAPWRDTLVAYGYWCR